MICGIDEAGRGPVLGPLVVCGISIKSDEALRRLGVKDSKQLTPKRREELAKEIRKIAKVEVMEISAEEIDLRRENVSLNELEAEMFAQVLQRLSPEEVFVDAADVDEDGFGRMVQAHTTCTAKMTSRHKADETYPVVSAASIIAKVERDRRIREIEQDIGEPIGSGYASDENTMAFLESWVKRNGCCPPHTRQSWEPAQKIMMMKSVRKLESFEG